MLFVRTKFFSRWLWILNISGFCILRPVITKGNKIVYKRSIWLIFTTIAELLLLLIIFALELSFGKVFSGKDFTGKLIVSAILFGGLVVSFLQIILSLLETKNYSRYGQAVAKVSRNATKNDVSKFISGFIKFFLPFFFIYVFSVIWDSTFLFIIQESVYIFNLTALYIEHYYNLLVIAQYSMAIFCIENRLEKINGDLGQLQLQLKRGFWKMSDVLNPKKNNQVEEAATKKNLFILNPVEEIKRHRQFYQSIYDLCLKGNQTFSPKLLLAIVHDFLMATLFIYFAIQKTMSVYNKGWRTNEFWELSTSFRMAITFILSIYALIYASDLVYQQVSKIVQKIHIMSIETEDPKLEAQLNVFLIQIQSQKIAFSPYSFFELNKALLLKILGAISSYLILLLQFRVTL